MQIPICTSKGIFASVNIATSAIATETEKLFVTPIFKLVTVGTCDEKGCNMWYGGSDVAVAVTFINKITQLMYPIMLQDNGLSLCVSWLLTLTDLPILTVSTSLA